MPQRKSARRSGGWSGLNYGGWPCISGGRRFRSGELAFVGSFGRERRFASGDSSARRSVFTRPKSDALRRADRSEPTTRPGGGDADRAASLRLRGNPRSSSPWRTSQSSSSISCRRRYEASPTSSICSINSSSRSRRASALMASDWGENSLRPRSTELGTLRVVEWSLQITAGGAFRKLGKPSCGFENLREKPDRPGEKVRPRDEASARPHRAEASDG
jgi:hypothetical protein